MQHRNSSALTSRKSVESASGAFATASGWRAVIWAVAAVAGFAAVSSAAAQFTPGPPGQRGGQPTADQLVDVRIIADRAEVGPGETFHIVAHFDIVRPWHLYWKNPGEAGALAPSVDLTVPDGFIVGEMRWPRPKRLNSPAGEMFSYENQFALFIPITAPDELEDGSVIVQADYRFAVCESHRCLIGRGTQRPSITTRSTTTEGGALRGLPRRDTELIERHLKRLPRDINETDDASIEYHDEKQMLIFTLPAHGHEQATFFQHDATGVTYGKPEMTFDNDRLTVFVTLSINPNNFRGGPPMVGGLVALGREPHGPSYEGALSLAGQDRQHVAE